MAITFIDFDRLHRRKTLAYTLANKRRIKCAILFRVGHHKRRESTEIRAATQIKPITLAQICAAGIVTLNVACVCCSRRGRYKVTRLIDQHGASMNLVMLRDVLSIDCPRRLGSAMNPCGACFPDRTAIEKALQGD